MIAARLTVQAQTSRRLLSNRGLASQLLARPKEEWSYTELRREARERGVTQGGNKAALLARLQADDLTRAGHSEKGIRTSAAAAAAPKGTSSSKVTAPADTPVNATPAPAPERAAFKSSRTIRPGPSESPAPQIPGIPTSDNPFAPKRSAPLYVAIPREEDPIEEGPVIPVVPERYGSSPQDSASPPQPIAPADTPKIHAVSGLDEHLAAPAHPTNTTVVNPPVQAAPSSSSGPASVESWKDKFTAARKALGSTLQSPHWADEANHTKLDSDERKGVYGLAGIVFGGWLLGGLLKPSSNEE
ncbi:hypothetical protein M407DRAFT_9434 [Tulasnella calospora MUT 4182]|uniref:SAP domain-containing protein n=1 Tax=Tulasnella calospora MUT 4182 TaxID=1051891 RepID=A0A0C3LPT2_9AGAM|nr:hypothetical protein M407DRAFT_9434 [Tulasnella calospora MUT 4182]